MKNLKELIFKDLKEVAIIAPPKCEEHGEDLIIGLEDYSEDNILNLSNDILDDFDEKCAALILMDKVESKAIYPISVFDKERKEKDRVAVTFRDSKDLISNGKIEEYKTNVANKFNQAVTTNDIKVLLVLEQSKDDEGLFKFIY